MDIQRILSCQRPIDLLQEWLTEVSQCPEISEPTAMTLGTASLKGEASLRTVLLKELSEAGLVFYTNYNSTKGQQLDENPQAAVHFYWDPLFRQVKLQGQVEKVSRQKSVAYWQSRDRESQLSQVISQQSQSVERGVLLSDLVARARLKYEGQEIPCPEHWGGYLFKPQIIEFWLGRPHRLHERVQFDKLPGGNWQARQLYP